MVFVATSYQILEVSFYFWLTEIFFFIINEWLHFFNLFLGINYYDYMLLFFILLCWISDCQITNDELVVAFSTLSELGHLIYFICFICFVYIYFIYLIQYFLVPCSMFLYFSYLVNFHILVRSNIRFTMD